MSHNGQKESQVEEEEEIRNMEGEKALRPNGFHFSLIKVGWYFLKVNFEKDGSFIIMEN